jgi:hypothetical protein
MSFRFDTPLISGSFHLGNRGLGVIGSAIPSAGDNGPSYIYNDLSLPNDASKEYMGRIETFPASGTFFAYEDGSFEYSGPSGSFVYRLFEDGVDKGTGTVTLTLSDTPIATIGWTEASDTFSSVANVKDSLTVSWTENSDIFSVTADILGTNASMLSWSEADDLVSIVGDVASTTVSSALGWTETDDASAVQVGSSASITITHTEANDTFTVLASALINAVGTVSWNETNDVMLSTVYIPVASPPIPSNVQVKFRTRRYKIKFRRD